MTAADGNLIGVEDARGVRLVDAQQLEAARRELHEELGKPKVIHTEKGDFEVWQVSDDPPSTVTYRPNSRSGGATIDINNVDGLPDLKRLHIREH